jgi:hypothetical protein
VARAEGHQGLEGVVTRVRVTMTDAEAKLWVSKRRAEAATCRRVAAQNQDCAAVRDALEVRAEKLELDADLAEKRLKEENP